MLRRSLAILLLCSPSLAAAESYITDTLNVGVYASDDLLGEPLIYIKSGDRVEVIETKGDKRLVMTEGEEVGWMRATFITTREPLIKQLEAAKQEIAQLQEDLEAEQNKKGSLAAKEQEASKNVAWMRGEMNKARKKAEELEKELKALKAKSAEKQALQAQEANQNQGENQSEFESLMQEKDALEKQLAAALMIGESEQPEVSVETVSPFTWLAPIIALLLGLGAGAAVCYRWMDNRLTKRFGGIRFHH